MSVHEPGRVVSTALLVALVSMGWLGGQAQATRQSEPQRSSNLRLARAHRLGGQASCGPVHSGHGRCLSYRLTVDGQPLVTATPSGYAPTDLQSAYNLPSRRAGVGQTVGIVDAFDNPNAESDLAVYRSMFGLPACTTSNGCFTKVNQDGAPSPLPKPDVGWGFEIALDLQMVSALCPNCHILLVEASNANEGNMLTGINTAARLGANEISNSWTSNESASDVKYDAEYLDHPGIALVAGTGDWGYKGYGGFPAAAPTVTSVGGTSLARATNKRGWTETAWSGTGSGCSKVEPKPTWQTDAGCGARTSADVSAIADYLPFGVSVYDTLGDPQGWFQAYGTSVATPIIASTYALAGNAASLDQGAGSTYDAGESLNDVTSGSNGSCKGSYLCAAGPGYDGPTGNGTPNGTGAF